VSEDGFRPTLIGSCPLLINSSITYNYVPSHILTDQIIILNMKLMNVTASIFLVIAVLCKSVAAFPKAIGNCTEGISVIQGKHVGSTVRTITGSLATGGYSVSLGGARLVVGANRNFTVNTATTITISSTSKKFRGFLIRLGGVGTVQTTGALSSTSSDVQVAPTCTTARVAGVIHTSKSDKTTVSATLTLPSLARRMPLDVTIVTLLKGGVSEYYSSRFFLTSIPRARAGPTRS
jgi:hypothetical protein